MGSTMGFTTILVGKLQQEDDEALRMSLEDASWIGKLNYSEEPESIYLFQAQSGHWHQQYPLYLEDCWLIL